MTTRHPLYPFHSCLTSRGQGLGEQLMTAMLDLLKAKGYPSVSLSVSKDNPAVRFYQRLGFVTVEEREDDYLMLCRL